MVKPTQREELPRDEFAGSFTSAWVDMVPTKPIPKNKQVQYLEQQGKNCGSLVLSISYGGTKTWRALFYVTDGKGRRVPRTRRIGTYPQMTVAQARVAVSKFSPEKAIASTEAGTFKKVAEDWIVDHVDKKGLRSKKEIVRQLHNYVYPEWEHTKIFDINRTHVNDLLRKIEKKHGASQADAVLATIRSIMGWYAVEHHAYTSPIVRKMQRDKRESREKARYRTLDHRKVEDNGGIYVEWHDRGEIRAVWKACEHEQCSPPFGPLVKMLLLTGQRLQKVADMQWGDIADGVWTIRTDKREKGNAGKIKLPQIALDLIDQQPRIADNPYVFPGRNGKLNSFAQRKKELDRLLPADMEPWVLHDLRRTARSLMARAGVLDNIAERTLGHVVTGVQGVYLRHDYAEEKADALNKLARQIDTILNPHDNNVVSLRR